MYDEVQLLFESIVNENRSVVSFLDCDYTFLNETLATVYGLEGEVTGPAMRRVQLNNPDRGGILGMPGVLATTSFPNRTSPVNRGVWVLEQILGEHVPPPPPNVPTLEKQDKAKTANLTLRQRTELHRTNAVCMSCHKVLDPIGFGLENFDAIGRWRDRDNGKPVDPAVSFESEEGATLSLKAAADVARLAVSSQKAHEEFVRQLFLHCVKQPPAAFGPHTEDRLARQFEAGNFHIRNLLVQIALTKALKDFPPGTVKVAGTPR
jgi:hypothetical protein